jgi:hypothetical protein
MSDKTLALEHIIRNIAEGKFTPSDEPKVNLAHAIRDVHESVGTGGSDKPAGTPPSFLTRKYSSQGSNMSTKNVQAGKGVVAKQRQQDPIKMESAPSDMSGVTAGLNSALTTESGKKKVKEESGYVPNQGNAATVAQWASGESGKKKIKESAEPEGTIERRKVKFVARPDDADPKSPKSTLGKLGQIKTKIVDEEKVIAGKTPVIIDPPLKQISPDGDKLGGTRPQRDRLKTIVKEAIKEDAATSIATKAAGGLGKKLLPGVGVAYGVADAISRAKSGDYLGAGIAGASSAASLVPVVGTAVSAGLDAANLYRDYKSGAFDDKKDEVKPSEPEKAPEPEKPVSNIVNKPKQTKSNIKPFKGIKK